MRAVCHAPVMVYGLANGPGAETVQAADTIASALLALASIALHGADTFRPLGVSLRH